MVTHWEMMEHIGPMKQKSLSTLAPGIDRIFITPLQLSERWWCSIEKLKRMRRAGKLPVYYLGRTARYSMDDIRRIEAEAKA